MQRDDSFSINFGEEEFQFDLQEYCKNPFMFNDFKWFQDIRRINPKSIDIVEKFKKVNTYTRRVVNRKRKIEEESDDESYVLGEEEEEEEEKNI